MFRCYCLFLDDDDAKLGNVTCTASSYGSQCSCNVFIACFFTRELWCFSVITNHWIYSFAAICLLLVFADDDDDEADDDEVLDEEDSELDEEEEFGEYPPGKSWNSTFFTFWQTFILEMWHRLLWMFGC